MDTLMSPGHGMTVSTPLQVLKTKLDLKPSSLPGRSAAAIHPMQPLPPSLPSALQPFQLPPLRLPRSLPQRLHSQPAQTPSLLSIPAPFPSWALLLLPPLPLQEMEVVVGNRKDVLRNCDSSRSYRYMQLMMKRQLHDRFFLNHAH